jgi:AcrR family transcriptional regulator
LYHERLFMNERSQTIETSLVDAAASLLAERQTTAVTARDIARRAGLSDGVLYNYFEDKPELVLAALTHSFERLGAELEEALPEPGAGEIAQGLRQAARALLRFHERSWPMIASVAADPALLRRFLVAIHAPGQYAERVRRPVADYLRAEQRLGRLAAADVDSATDLLIGGTAILALNGERGARRLRKLVATLHEGLA